MKDLTQIDPNFAVHTEFDTSNLEIRNALDAPFIIYGLLPPDVGEDSFCRLPRSVAEKVNEGVLLLHRNTAGGRVRFQTNSTSVAIFAHMNPSVNSSHFALTGKYGFDMYAGTRYMGTFIPPNPSESGFSSLLKLGPAEEREITINFPLYADVKTLYIGLDKDATLSAPSPYAYEKPVVYYGSSITQGGCASRPGNSYESIIERRLNCDYVNLGFSGSAQGEPVMAEYIASIPMQAFVCDYDHNAPSPEHLAKTHWPLFETIRQKQPEVPIVIVSRPELYPTGDTRRRLAILQETYQKALARGDKNVYFIDGHKMMWEFADDGATVDGCHPNDYGFVAMAKKIGSVLEEILQKA